MATKNIPAPVLLNAIADLLDEFPHLHNQETWESTPEDNACGTTACIAGWACILGTDDFKQKEMKVDGSDEKGIFWVPKKRAIRDNSDLINDDLDELDAEQRISRLADWQYFGRVGAELLDLDDSDSQLLFHGEGRPRRGLSVPEALREIASGADVWEVWTSEDEYDDDCEDGICDCDC